MDLAAEADRLRLDVLALELSAALTSAGIAHALLKGPSTANWLYSPPRTYRDVDLLVPPSQLPRAAQLLAAAGLARPKGGLVGEEAEHSLLLVSEVGFEVDLHRSLPAVPSGGHTTWELLAQHLEPLDLGLGSVPALDEPARCLVLALHAVGNPDVTGQPVEDLRRARRAAPGGSWTIAARLADEIGVRDLFEAGLAIVEPAHGTVSRSRRARLYASSAPSGALALERLASAPRRSVPRLIMRELVPSRGFMREYQGSPTEGSFRLLRAHLARWRVLVRELPSSARAWWGAHRDR